MKNKTYILKRLLIFQLIAVFGELAVIGFILYVFGKYANFKNVWAEIVLIILLIDFIKLISPMIFSPYKIILDGANKKVIILYPFHIMKKEILLDEIQRIEYNYKRVKSLINEPDYNIIIYQGNKEKVVIPLLMLRKYKSNKYTRTDLYPIYIFVMFFGEKFTKDNKEAIFKKLRGWLVFYKDMKKTYFYFFIIEEILKVFNISFEEFTREENKYDKIKWEEYYKFREDYKNNRMFE